MICRSADDRSSQRLKIVLELASSQQKAWGACARAAFFIATTLSKELSDSNSTRNPSASYSMLRSTDDVAPGSRGSVHITRFCPPRSGRRSSAPWRVARDRQDRHTHQVRLSRFVRQAFAPPRPPGASHLEDIGEVSIEKERYGSLDVIESVVGDLDPLDASRVPQHPRPADIDLTTRDRDHPVAQQIGIREVGFERRVVGAHRRTQKQRLVAVQHQL